MFYKIGNSRVVHNGSVFVFVLFVFWQSVVGIFANRQQCFGNLFAAVGSRFIVPTYTYSPRIRNPFEMPSRNVRNVFILCMLHIHHAKVWFLRHKSMVFGVQKPPFYIAKTPFLKCEKPDNEHGTTKCGIIYNIMHIFNCLREHLDNTKTAETYLNINLLKICKRLIFFTL